MAKPANTQTESVDYISCDLPSDMTLEQFRRGRCAEQRRLSRLRALSSRWLHRQPRP